MVSLNKIVFNVVFCLILLLLGIISIGYALEDEDELGELLYVFERDLPVVTATLHAVKASQAPATIYVITEEQIANRGYQDLHEVLRDVPGFDFIFSDGWTAMRTFQRGIIGNNRMLLLINGQKENSISAGSNLNWGHIYPLQDVKQIELISGPASALYGADAYSGIVNVITKSGLGTDQKNQLSISYGSYDTRIASVVLSNHLRAVGISYRFSARFYRTDGPDLAEDYKDSGILNDVYNYAGTDTLPYDLGYSDPANDYALNALVNIGDVTIGGYIWNRDEGVGTYYNPSKYVLNNNTIHLCASQVYITSRQTLSPKLEAVGTVSYRQDEMLNDSGFYYPTGDHIGEKKYYWRYGKGVKLESQFTWTTSNKHRVLFGAMYEDMETIPNQDQYGNMYFPEPEKIYNYQNYGFFLQGELLPHRLFSITLGSRYDYNSDYKGVLNPRMGIVFSPNSDWTFKGLYGTAYLAPTSNQMYYEFQSSSEKLIRNPDLTPEIIHTGELSVGWQPLSFLYLETNSYINKLSEMINRTVIGTEISGQDTLTVKQEQNVENMQTYGGESKIEFFWKKYLSIQANISYLDGKNNDDERLPDVAKIKSNIIATIHPIKPLTLCFRMNFVGNRSTSLTNSEFEGEDIDGYNVIHFNARYTKLFDLFDLGFRVNNLLDIEYYDPGDKGGSGARPSKHPQEKRSILFNINYDF